MNFIKSVSVLALIIALLVLAVLAVLSFGLALGFLFVVVWPIAAVAETAIKLFYRRHLEEWAKDLERATKELKAKAKAKVKPADADKQ